MTVNQGTPAKAPKVSEAFLQQVDALLAAQKDFERGAETAVSYSRIRESHLANALLELSKCYGISLETPLQIDSRGEFHLVALRKDGTRPSLGTDLFGEFVEVLNQFSPRTGLMPGATLLPDNGWCMMNHFDVERMVLAQSGKLAKTSVTAA